MTRRARTRLAISLLMGLLTTLTLATAVPIAFRSARACFPPAPPPPPKAPVLGGLPVLGRYFQLRVNPAPLLFTAAYTHVSDADLRGIRPVDRTGVPGWAAVVDDPGPADAVTTVASGWPFKCLTAQFWHARDGRELPRGWYIPVEGAEPVAAVIPLTPRPLGLVANTAAFSLLWFPAVLVLPAIEPAWWVAGRRLRQGRCPDCGDNLQWNLAPGCPECGWRRPPGSGSRT